MTEEKTELEKKLQNKLDKKDKELNKYKSGAIEHTFDKYFRTVGDPSDIGDIAKSVRKVYPYMRTLDESGYNDYHDYEYVPIDEMIEEINEGISQQIGDEDPGFAIFSTVMNHKIEKVGKYRDCMVKLLITFMHTETGAMIQTVASGIGRDNSEKHMFKAITNAFKYAIKYTFMIAAGGGDPEADSYTTEDIEEDTKEKTSNKKKKDKSKKNKKQMSVTNGKTNKKKENDIPKDKKKEIKKIKEKWSEHNKVVKKECKSMFKENDMETNNWSNLKELSVEDLKKINDNIEDEIE